MPDYTRMETVTLPFTAPSNGLLIFNLDNGGSQTFSIDGTDIPIQGNDASNEGPVALPIKAGSTAKITNTSYSYNPRFIPYNKET